ncbi:UNVERIFIED_CONTAM: hypothetical protein Sradi_3177400 [Sesamum radiatum]|uniref:RNase H type-1 domain-containing protein n=1 Tax=Sesamum radiatum TaxID=300843 RepID=A0AAW2RFF0_SESRA
MGYLWKLYKAKGFKPVHWREDLLVAKRIGFVFNNVGIWKLNCDGPFIGYPGPSGAWGPIRNSWGRMLLAFYDFLGEHTNTFAELYAISGGFHLAWENGRNVVGCNRSTSDNRRRNRQLQSLLTSIRRLKRKINIYFTHVYREANQPADFLAAVLVISWKLLLFLKLMDF